MPSCRVHVVATSAAPPSAVFALLADIDTWCRWGAWERSELESAAPDGTGGVGAVRRLTSRAFGRTIVSRERVEEVVADRRIVYALLSGLPLVGYRGVVELEPDGAGGTKITWSSSFDPKTWGTGWFYRAILQRFIADTAAAVGRAAERAAARAA
jgi:hypothetical protein